MYIFSSTDTSSKAKLAVYTKSIQTKVCEDAGFIYLYMVYMLMKFIFTTWERLNTH